MISTHANTGAYAFASAAVLRRYCALILDEAVGEVGEYHTTNIIHRMIEDGTSSPRCACTRRASRVSASRLSCSSC